MPRRTVSLDELDNFKIDTDTRQLFWFDKEVVTSMSLPLWAQIAGITTAAASVVIAIADATPKLIALIQYLAH